MKKCDRLNSSPCLVTLNVNWNFRMNSIATLLPGQPRHVQCANFSVHVKLQKLIMHVQNN